MRRTSTGLKFGIVNRGRTKMVKDARPSSRRALETICVGQRCRPTASNSSKPSTPPAHWARTTAISTLFACLSILLETTIATAKSVFHDRPGQILASRLSMNAQVVFTNAIKMLSVTTRLMDMAVFARITLSEMDFTAKELLQMQGQA